MMMLLLMMMTTAAVKTVTAGVVEVPASKISVIHLKNNMIHSTAEYI